MTKTKYADQKTRQLLDLALRYGFTCRKLSDNLSAICAKNTDGESVSWIVYDRSEDELSVRGNTDNMNIWLSETRPDMTMEQCCSFVKELAEFSGRPLVFSWKGVDLNSEDNHRPLVFSLVIDWEDIQEMPHTDPAFSSFNGQNIEECVEAFLKNEQSR